MYQKKSQFDHIFLRPDTYIESVEKHTQTLWVYENEEMVQRPVAYVDEINNLSTSLSKRGRTTMQRREEMTTANRPVRGYRRRRIVRREEIDEGDCLAIVFSN
ncbi:hypothetical protein Rs2_47986 [Raphanus sativus]|nr:hypothetical protein Rs2_47986 [Raphanus sativus]